MFEQLFVYVFAGLLVLLVSLMAVFFILAKTNPPAAKRFAQVLVRLFRIRYEVERPPGETPRIRLQPSTRFRRLRRALVIAFAVIWAAMGMIGFILYHDLYIGFGGLLLALLAVFSLRFDTRRKEPPRAR